ncbi:hypothetical protein, partial [Acetonema longum]
MQEQTIKVCVKTELKDYYALASVIRGKWQIPTNIIFSLAAIIAILIGQYSSASILIILIVCNHLWTKLQDRKIYESNKIGQKERWYTISENGIIIASLDGNSTSYVEWTEMYGARQ